MAFISGKGNLLDAIHDFDPQLTGRYLRLQGDDPDFLRKAEEFVAQNPGVEYLFRSDASCEDFSDGRRIIGFPGVFESNNFYGLKKLDYQRRIISEPHDLAAFKPEVVFDFLERTKGYFPEGSKEHQAFAELINIAEKEKVDDLGHLQSVIAALFSRRNIRGDYRVTGEELDVFNFLGSIGKAMEVKDYADARGADISDSQMNFILHQKIFGAQFLVMEHPNLEDMIHYEFQHLGSETNLWKQKDLRKSNGNNPEYVKSYLQLIEGLRKEGKLNPHLVYVAEGVGDKIVQLRPAFKRDYREGHPVDVLGTIPDEGLFFDRGSPDDDSPFEYQFYSRMINCYDLSNLRFSKENIPPGTELFLNSCNDTHGVFSDKGYLTHAGLRVLEAVQVYDCSSSARDSYQRCCTAKKIRYFQDKQGSRQFEKAA